MTTEDIKYAGSVLKVREFPSLGIFRNGDFKLHQGSLKVPARELLSWLVDEDTLEIEGKIEEVNLAMLDRFLKYEQHLLALLYDDDDDESKEFHDVLKSLELVDDKLDKLDNNTVFVKCSDDDVARDVFGFQVEILVVIFKTPLA